jgi:hypothetical protein
LWVKYLYIAGAGAGDIQRIIMQISFIASIPDIQSAINISGQGFTRIKLDIPESEIADAVKLLLFKGQSFRVTIDNGRKD